MQTLCSNNLTSASVSQHFMVCEVLSHLLCHWIDCKQSACLTNEETKRGRPAASHPDGSLVSTGLSAHPLLEASGLQFGSVSIAFSGQQEHKGTCREVGSALCLGPHRESRAQL